MGRRARAYDAGTTIVIDDAMPAPDNRGAALVAYFSRPRAE